MRADQELDVRSLYLAGVSGFSGGGGSSRQSGAGHDEGTDEAAAASSETDKIMGHGRVTDSGHTVVEAEHRADLRHLLQRLPGQLLAPVDRLRVGHA